MQERLAGLVLVLILIFTVNVAFADLESTVKLSSAGICHNEDSSYYTRTKTFTAYSDMKDCLDAGGRLPTSQQNVIIKAASDYDRPSFGAWIDEDNDCLNTRHELLIERSMSETEYNDNCVVIKGTWLSAYTGETLSIARDLDIDHVVSVRFAWDHGAMLWSRELKVLFLNDPLNLEIVEASVNRSKGPKGIREWTPSKDRCAYMAHFLLVAEKYGLSVTKDQAYFVLECT